jgi:hypothetical protein
MEAGVKAAQQLTLLPSHAEQLLPLLTYCAEAAARDEEFVAVPPLVERRRKEERAF